MQRKAELTTSEGLKKSTLDSPYFIAMARGSSNMDVNFNIFSVT